MPDMCRKQDEPGTFQQRAERISKTAGVMSKGFRGNTKRCTLAEREALLNFFNKDKKCNGSKTIRYI